MTLLTSNRASAILHAFLRQTLSEARHTAFLIPANICPVVPLVFAKLQIPIEFYDCAVDNWLPDESGLLSRVAAAPHRWAGVLYSGTIGYLPDTRSLYRNLRGIKPDLIIIEDRCLAAPQWKLDLQPALADLVLYSTGYAKYVDLGRGGFGFSRNPIDINAEQLSYEESAWRDMERRTKQALATKTRFIYEDTSWLCTEPLGMAEEVYFARVEAERDRMFRHKAQLNQEYASQLPAQIRLPDEFQQWRFTLSLDDPARALELVHAAELFASRHFQPLDGIFSDAVTCPNAHAHYARILNLFNDRYFTLEQARSAAGVIRDHVDASKAGRAEH